MNFSSIESVRQTIDDIDSQLVALTGRRGECVKAAAVFKKDQEAFVLLIGFNW